MFSNLCSFYLSSSYSFYEYLLFLKFTILFAPKYLLKALNVCVDKFMCMTCLGLSQVSFIVWDIRRQ